MKIDSQELKAGDRINIISGRPVRRRWDLLHYLQMRTYLSFLRGQRKQPENGIYIVTSLDEMKDQRIKELEHDVNEFYMPLVKQLKSEIAVRDRAMEKLMAVRDSVYKSYVKNILEEARAEIAEKA